MYCNVWRRCTATYGGDVLSCVEVMSGHCVSSLLVSSVCVKSSVFWSVLCVSGQFYVCPVCWSVLCVQSVGQLYVFMSVGQFCVYVCWSVRCVQSVGQFSVVSISVDWEDWLTVRVHLLTDPCFVQEFKCQQIQHCVHDDLTCDGWDDCGDYSDEREEAGCNLLTATEICSVIMGIILLLGITAQLVIYFLTNRRLIQQYGLVRLCSGSASAI